MRPVSYDASTAECLVFTYKAGLLAGMAHDLKLRVERFEIAVDDRGVHARFDAGSLRVVSAQVDGQDDPRALSEKNRRDIEATVAREVLDARRHPAIEFSSSAVAAASMAPAEVQLDGTLSIRGQERPVSLRVRREGDRAVIEKALHQPDFGIRPYTAMLGALRLQPDVRVRITAPWPQ